MYTMSSIWTGLFIFVLTNVPLQGTAIGFAHDHGLHGKHYERLIAIAVESSILYESDEYSRFEILEILKQKLYDVAQYMSVLNHAHLKHDKGDWRSQKIHHKENKNHFDDDDDNVDDRVDDDRPEAEVYGGTNDLRNSVKHFLRTAQKYGFSSSQTDALFRGILSAPYSEDIVNNIKQCISDCILHDGRLPPPSTPYPPLTAPHPVHVHDFPRDSGHDSDNGITTTMVPLSILMHPYDHGKNHPDVDLFYHCHHNCMHVVFIGLGK